MQHHIYTGETARANKVADFIGPVMKNLAWKNATNVLGSLTLPGPGRLAGSGGLDGDGSP